MLRFLGIGIVVLILGWGLFNLVKERVSLSREVNNLSKTLISLQEENRNLTAKIEYFKNPENLLKELKSQFNYTEKGENLIIIVPAPSSSKR